jgi:TRAP-type mannitol/chloroaromatic compound transport system permease small subunit
MLDGTLFMMAGTYALSRGAHVRGDFLYRSFSARTQAAFDFGLYFLFFLPGMAALIYSGWDFFDLSYTMNERSSFSPGGPIVWPFKALIPIAGALMLLQGLAEIVRCAICLSTGRWPQRLGDVEELERELLTRAEAGRRRTCRLRVVADELRRSGLRSSAASSSRSLWVFRSPSP